MFLSKPMFSRVCVQGLKVIQTPSWRIKLSHLRLGRFLSVCTSASPRLDRCLYTNYWHLQSLHCARLRDVPGSHVRQLSEWRHSLRVRRTRGHDRTTTALYGSRHASKEVSVCSVARQLPMSSMHHDIVSVAGTISCGLGTGHRYA